MATSLLLSVLLLLGLTTATSPQYSSVRDIVHGLSDACMEGVSRSATHQELRSGQEETRSGQGHTQEQLTALQAQLTALQPSPEDCPAGWSRHGDNCYFIPPQKTSWLRAHHACAVLDRRARLASVHPASSQHIETLVATSSDWGVWVGLAWLDGDAGWGWSDGTPLDLTKWSPGEPSGGGSENCGHLWGPKDNRRGWNNYVCGNAISFLCQITLV